jgi:hypothetical protein
MATLGRAYYGTTLVAGGITMPSFTDEKFPATSLVSTTPGVAHDAPSAWTEIFSAASITKDYHWLRGMLAASTSSNGANTSAIIELGTGALNSETVVATFAAGYLNTGGGYGVYLCDLPFLVASGTRLSFRARSLILAKAFTVGWTLGTLPVASKVPVSYGADTATSRGLTITDPGSTGTYGTNWTVLSASTSQAFQAFHIGPQGAGASTLNTGEMSIEIGYGTVGNEFTVARMPITISATTEYITKRTMSGLVPSSQIVPAGSRLVARYKRSNSNQTLDLIVQGIPV